jgi:tetratricopeptide (TPR) repeat protein
MTHSQVNPTSEDEFDLVDKATSLFKDGQYADAIECYDKLIENKELGGEAFFGKAECLQRLEQHEAAIENYDKAIEFDEDNPLYWNGKGVSLYHLRDFTKAIICFDVASDLDPDNFDYQLSVAETAMLQHAFHEAGRVARTVLEKSEDEEDIAVAWALSAIAFFLQGNMIPAIDTLGEMVNHFKDLEGQIGTAEQFTGSEYDLCEIEKLVEEKLTGADKEIITALLGFVKGTTGVDALAKVLNADAAEVNIPETATEPEPEEPVPDDDDEPEYPDLDELIDADERRSIEQIEEIIGQEEDYRFQTFESLFDDYDWNLDQGPAPFKKELDNAFFLDIQEGHITRASFDADYLIKEVALKGYAGADNVFQSIHQLVRLPWVQELYITAEEIQTVIDTVRAMNLGSPREITLFAKVDLIPGQDSILEFANNSEVSELDALPVDYHDENNKLVATMNWTVRGT